MKATFRDVAWRDSIGGAGRCQDQLNTGSTSQNSVIRTDNFAPFDGAGHHVPWENAVVATNVRPFTSAFEDG
jgi:hypothetical protein